jgi:hypothetical protein
MITGRAQLEVCLLCASSFCSTHVISAAFLTQTVTLDSQTTVKFEIWSATPLAIVPIFLTLQ